MHERASKMGMIGLCVALVALSIGESRADGPLARAAAMGRVAGSFETLSRRLPDAARKRLSSGVQNYVNLARRWREIGPMVDRARRQDLGLSNALPGGVSTFAPSGISLPQTDRLFSRLAGFVQSETSTAWCGPNMAVGYNDSASVFRGAFFSPSGSLSFDGYAFSTNIGTSFTSGAALLPDPIPAGVALRDLFGDPVVGCATRNKFFFSSLAMDILNDMTTQISGVSVSASTNGGVTFGGAVMAVGKDAGTHIVDKDWFTVDPTNVTRLYVTYTDFDLTGALCGTDVIGDPIGRSAIEIVSSADSGATWSLPTVVKETCFDSTGFVQGSQVIVGNGGGVFVAYESFDVSNNAQIEVTKSTDGAQSFATPVVVSPVTAVGGVNPFGTGAATLQGGFKINEFPSLAVDRSDTASRGTLYVAWNDGRNAVVGDALTGTYAYADILVSHSMNGGATWSAPVKVNDNAEPLASGLSTDQYEPALAVDQTTGTVGVCFYDRRRDAGNFLIDRECAKSLNRGATWTNTRITTNMFAPEIDQDALVGAGYMGDYDTLAADFRRVNPGLFGAWGDNTRGNPDVVGSRF